MLATRLGRRLGNAEVIEMWKLLIKLRGNKEKKMNRIFSVKKLKTWLICKKKKKSRNVQCVIATRELGSGTKSCI